MFQEEGLDIPPNLVEASSITFITRMLQQSDFVSVVPMKSPATTQRMAWSRSCLFD